MKYDAFISYNQKADRILAGALRSALHRYTKPFYKLRALRVFRDTATLEPGVDLLGRIVNALDDSRYLILMASPESAAGEYTNEEVEHWLEKRSSNEILIILTSGVIEWDAGAGDFDWEKTSSLPSALRGKFAAAPLWVDMRWAAGSSAVDLTLRSNPRFKKAVADLSAAIQGKELDTIYGEDRVQHQRTLCAIWVAAALIVGGVVFGTLRWVEERAARKREVIARAEVGLRMGRELAFSGRPKEGIAAVEEVLPSVQGEVEVEPRMRQAISWWAMELGVEFETKAPVLAATVNPAGRQVSLLDEAGTNYVFPPDGSTRGSEVTLEHFPQQVRLAAYSPGSRAVALADEGGNLHVWGLPDGRALGDPLPIHPPRRINALEFDRTGERLAVACGKDVYIVDLKNLAKVEVLRPPKNPSKVTAVTFDPTGKRIAFGLSGGEFWVMEIGGQPESAVRLPKPPGRPTVMANVVAWAPVGDRILGSTSDRCTRIWQKIDKVGWRSQRPLVTEQPIDAATFSRGGSTVLSVDHLGEVGAWLVRGTDSSAGGDSAGVPPRLLRFGRQLRHGGEFLKIAAGWRGEVLVYGGRRPATLWRLFGSSTAPSPLGPPATPLFSAEIMPRFRIAVLGASDGKLRTFRLSDWGIPLWSREVAPGRKLKVTSARQDGAALVAAGTTDGSISFFEPIAGTSFQYEASPRDGIWGLEVGKVSGRPKSIAWQIDPIGNNEIHLSDLEKSEAATLLDVGESTPLVARVSSGGKYVAVGTDDGNIHLFDAAGSGQAFEVVSPGLAAVIELAFHPDDDRVFCSGHADGRLYQWRIAGREANLILGAGDAGSMVRALSYTPDGSVIVAGTARGTFAAWSAFDLTRLSSVYHVASYPDLSVVNHDILAISVSDEHTITAIDVDGRLFHSIGGATGDGVDGSGATK